MSEDTKVSMEARLPVLTGDFVTREHEAMMIIRYILSQLTPRERARIWGWLGKVFEDPIFPAIPFFHASARPDAEFRNQAPPDGGMKQMAQAALELKEELAARMSRTGGIPGGSIKLPNGETIIDRSPGPMTQAGCGTVLVDEDLAHEVGLRNRELPAAEKGEAEHA
jgi:hypothetical protein